MAGPIAQFLTGDHRRLTALLAHDVNLLAYHLPLDAHERRGHARPALGFIEPPATQMM